MESQWQALAQALQPLAHRPQATSLRIDPTQNVFNQAFAQLYNNHSKSLRHFGSVVFETHGAKDAGIDHGALTRDFIAELAGHIPSADLLHNLYGDSIYRLAPIRFVERIRDQEGFIHKFPDVPQSSVPEDRLRFLGGVLARFFLGGSQTSSGSLPLASGLLPFAMDPRIYAALAAGVAPELKPAAEDVVALPECGGVAALLGNADGNASDIFKFFTKDYYEAESMRVFPLGMDFPDARASVVAACKRYVDAAWAKPINWVLEGWLQELGGQQGLGKRRAGREPVDFAEHLRGAMQRTEPLAIENLTGVSLTVSVADNVNGSAEDFMPTFEGALKEIRDGSDALRVLSGEMNAPWRPSGGDQRVRDVVQYWTGSPNYDNTKEYKLHVKQHTECQYGNYGVYASACDWRLDVPAACFQGGINLTAQALFYTAVMNGKGYGMV
uniref:Uncharacterized protein n=1 Tax=Zooxanthella nutricula TaxID=1333877 RepID=A0A7S2LGK8_9DINO